MSIYKQKNVTLTDDQIKVLKENVAKKTAREIAKMLGTSPNRVQANKELLGLSEPVTYNRNNDFSDKNGNFDIEKWRKNFIY